MSGNLVVNTNPYLKDPKTLADGIARMVKSSSAIEGIYVDIQVSEKNGNYEFTVMPKSTEQK